MPLSTLESTLRDAIRERAPALLTDLRRHVALATGLNNTPALDETRDALTSRLASLGADITLIPGDPKADWLSESKARGPTPPTAICRRHVANARARVLLGGHLDTVHDPAGPFQALTIAADGKTAVGPGCVDMKGGLVIAITALEALDACGVRASWGFVLNSDEETGSYHSDAALRTEAASGYVAGLVLEPALPGGELVTHRPGSGQFMIETTGRAVHVGRDFASGVSAVTALAACIIKVAAMPDPARGLIANIGPLEGGIATNVVPDGARAWGNVRYPRPEWGEEMGRTLDALATPPGILPGVAVRRSFNRPAKPLTPEVERLALAARAVAEDLGGTLPFATTGGVCDGNNFQAAGLPTIDTLGVRGGGLHTPTEWIELASLVERCQLLAILIARLSERGFPAPAPR